MKKQSKKVALQCATFAALFGLMSFFMDMMEETEKQTTYSVTLEDLALGNGETNGETGGVSGGGADGESDEGTNTPRGYSQITVTQITQMEIQNIDACTQKERSREALSTVCTGEGTILCTPGVVPTTRWSAWKLETKDKEGCQ